MQVLLAHPGTQHSLRLAQELAQRRLLGTFHTGLAWTEDSWWPRLSRPLTRIGSLQGMARRLVSGIEPAQLRTYPLTELRALISTRMGGDTLSIFHRRNSSFQKKIPDSDILSSDGIIGFDTSSWLLIARAHALNRRVWLDRTIAHPAVWLKWQARLHQRYPAWCPAPRPRPHWLESVEKSEHREAWRVVVGSQFAANSLIATGVDNEKIRVNPYGVEWDKFALNAVDSLDLETGARPLRFLFVGTVCARKGVPLLIDAWRQLGSRRGDAELWIAGRCAPELRTLIPELPGLKVLGQVPRNAMAALYQKCDVLVLPSFLEGFALVILEALAAGLLCMTTENSGAGEVLQNPNLTRKIPAGDADALLSSMQQIIDSPPKREDVIKSLGSIKQRYRWSAYAERWQQLLEETT